MHRYSPQPCGSSRSNGGTLRAVRFGMNTVTAKIAADIIAIAELHIGQGRRPMSVRECLTDAMTWYEQGEFMFAAKRALKSLHYSVGADHADYQQAAALIG